MSRFLKAISIYKWLNYLKIALTESVDSSLKKKLRGLSVESQKLV